MDEPVEEIKEAKYDLDENNAVRKTFLGFTFRDWVFVFLIFVVGLGLGLKINTGFASQSVTNQCNDFICDNYDENFCLKPGFEGLNPNDFEEWDERGIPKIIPVES